MLCRDAMEKREGHGEATRIFQERRPWLLRGQAADMAGLALCPVRNGRACPDSGRDVRRRGLRADSQGWVWASRWAPSREKGR